MHGDNAYIVLKRRLAEQFNTNGNTPNMGYLKEYRDWIGADHVLRDQTHFIFCETVQDIEWEDLEVEK
jgi:hypothetical protein